MTEKELTKARKKYDEYQAEKKEILEKQKELEKLKQSPDVIKYLKLKEYESTKVLTDEEIVYNAFNMYSYCTFENKKIYIYQGSYSTFSIINPTLIPIKKLNSYINYYNIYINLESGEIKYIEKEEITLFESQNNVMYFLPENGIETEESYKGIYKQVKKDYFKMLTTISEEKAISKLKIRSRKP